MVSSIGLQLMLLNLLISFFFYYLSLMDFLFYHGWQVHLHWIGKFKVFKHICSCFNFFSIGSNWMKKCCKIKTAYTLHYLGHCNYPWWNELQTILVPFLVQELLLFVVMVLLSMLLLSLDFINEPCCFTMLLFMSIVKHYFSWVLLKCCYSLTWTPWTKVGMQQPNDGR